MRRYKLRAGWQVAPVDAGNKLVSCDPRVLSGPVHCAGVTQPDTGVRFPRHQHLVSLTTWTELRSGLQDPRAVPIGWLFLRNVRVRCKLQSKKAAKQAAFQFVKCLTPALRGAGENRPNVAEYRVYIGSKRAHRRDCTKGN